MEHLKYMREVPQADRVLYARSFARQRKHPVVGVMLAFFLGGLGAHHFYMGEIGLGMIYLLLSWTLVPAVVALVESVFMPGRTRRHNEALARELLTQFQ